MGGRYAPSLTEMSTSSWVEASESEGAEASAAVERSRGELVLGRYWPEEPDSVEILLEPPRGPRQPPSPRPPRQDPAHPAFYYVQGSAESGAVAEGPDSRERAYGTGSNGLCCRLLATLFLILCWAVLIYEPLKWYAPWPQLGRLAPTPRRPLQGQAG